MDLGISNFSCLDLEPLSISGQSWVGNLYTFTGCLHWSSPLELPSGCMLQPVLSLGPRCCPTPSGYQPPFAPLTLVLCSQDNLGGTTATRPPFQTCYLKSSGRTGQAARGLQVDWTSGYPVHDLSTNSTSTNSTSADSGCQVGCFQIQLAGIGDGLRLAWLAPLPGSLCGKNPASQPSLVREQA